MSVSLYLGASIVGGASNPTPAVTITRQAHHHPVTGDLKTIVTTWRIEGRLLYIAGGDTLATQIAALEALFSSMTGGEILQLKDGETVLASLSGATAVSGLRSTPPSYPEGRGVEWATRRSYVVEFSAEHVAGGETEWAEYTYTLSTDERGIDSVRIQGVYYHPGHTGDINVAAKSYMETRFPANASLYQRASDYESQGADADVQGRTSRFTIQDTGLWAPMPAGCSYASVTTSARKMQTGGGQTTVSGRFVGANRQIQPARDAVTSALTGYGSSKLLEYEESENAYDGSVSFTAVYFAPDASEIEMRETVTITPRLRDFRMVPVLDDTLGPLKQNTVWKPARAAQTGYRIRQTAPSPESPIWGPEHIKDQQITYASPEKDVNNDEYQHRVDWTYEFEFVDTPTFGGY